MTVFEATDQKIQLNGIRLYREAIDVDEIRDVQDALYVEFGDSVEPITDSDDLRLNILSRRESGRATVAARAAGHSAGLKTILAALEEGMPEEELEPLFSKVSAFDVSPFKDFLGHVLLDLSGDIRHARSRGIATGIIDDTIGTDINWRSYEPVITVGRIKDRNVAKEIKQFRPRELPTISLGRLQINRKNFYARQQAVRHSS